MEEFAHKLEQISGFFYLCFPLKIALAAKLAGALGPRSTEADVDGCIFGHLAVPWRTLVPRRRHPHRPPRPSNVSGRSGLHA